ncbi:hypothetical protein [Paenibacillus cookii]|uniref:hypothetical protein n=1 Tax=Paenibacillus cookii TaxID=157839 RepID=UPI001BB306A8|nr:hypothetical protein [Paenibacillus cookii]
MQTAYYPQNFSGQAVLFSKIIPFLLYDYSGHHFLRRRLHQEISKNRENLNGLLYNKKTPFGVFVLNLYGAGDGNTQHLDLKGEPAART